MKPLLFLSQRIPFPPNKGDKLRAFAALRHFARSWEVHLGCFIDDSYDWQYVDDLRAICAEVHCVGLDKKLATLRSARGLLTGASLSEYYFRSPDMAKWVSATLETHRPEAAFLYSSVMGQYVPAESPLRPQRVVMDFVDVDSVKWGQYADMQSGPMRWVYRRESRRLLEFDTAIALGCDANVFVSAPEADLFRSLAPAAAPKVHAISNGIDLDYFSPGDTTPSPFAAGHRPIVMTGAMDYWPNIDAALWFAGEMFPSIRAANPSATFTIVGGNPAPDIVKLGETDGIFVTGRVPDVRPYLAHAALVVAPLRVARGIQNKVLEGMSMGKPVITTSDGLTGIDAVPGREVLVADTPERFVDLSLEILDGKGGTELGARARELIIRTYDWQDKLAHYDRLLAGSAA